jgi:hypothetical protein
MPRPRPKPDPGAVTEAIDALLDAAADYMTIIRPSRYDWFKFVAKHAAAAALTQALGIVLPPADESGLPVFNEWPVPGASYHTAWVEDPVYSPERHQRWREKVRAARRALEALKVTPAELLTVWFHGGRSYSTDGKTPRLVTVEQHNVLKAFLDRDQAIDTQTLERVVANVASVMDKLAGKFGKGCLRRPKNRGDGYFITVRTRKPG